MLYFSAMKNKERNIKARQKWLQIYEELGSVTTASIKCGISRSTLYRWIERSKSEEDTKLSDKSKRPKTLSNLKVTDEIETLILDIRRKHNWGAQRISTCLLTENPVLL
jgi:transposase